MGAKTEMAACSFADVMHTRGGIIEPIVGPGSYHPWSHLARQAMRAVAISEHTRVREADAEQLWVELKQRQVGPAGRVLWGGSHIRAKLLWNPNLIPRRPPHSTPPRDLTPAEGRTPPAVTSSCSRDAVRCHAAMETLPLISSVKLASQSRFH